MIKILAALAFGFLVSWFLAFVLYVLLRLWQCLVSLLEKWFDL